MKTVCQKCGADYDHETEKGWCPSCESKNRGDGHEVAEGRVGGWRKPDDLDAAVSRVWVTQNAYVSGMMVMASGMEVSLGEVMRTESKDALSDGDYNKFMELVGDAYTVALMEIVEKAIDMLGYWRGCCSVEQRERQEAAQGFLEERLTQGSAGPQRASEGDDMNRSLDVKQAADLLGVTVHAIRQRIKNARKRNESTPFHRVELVGTGKLYASKSDLLTWDTKFRRPT